MELLVDTESERRVLSGMLNSESTCIETLDVLNDNDFADPVNRNTFNLIAVLFSQGVTPTFIELLREGRKLGWLEKPQDVEQVKYIAESYIEDENSAYWIQNVKTAARGRKAQQIIKTAYEKAQYLEDVNGFITEVSDKIFSLALDNNETERIDTPQELAKLGVELLDERVERWRKAQEEAGFGEIILEGTPTGFKTLDNLTLGYKPGDLIILGAQTGKGKTAFALNVAKTVCIDSRSNLLYVNTEMSKNQIVSRLGAILSGQILQQIRNGSVTDAGKDIIKNGYQDLADSGFYSITIPNLTPAKLEIQARKAKIQHDIKLLILDYVGRMDKSDPRLAEWQILEQIVKAQKTLAQNLGIACLVLVQLNPDGTLQGAKRMKNEADLLMKLVEVNEEQKQAISQMNRKKYEVFTHALYIDKARDSPSGVYIPLIFDKDRQLMLEAEEI